MLMIIIIIVVVVVVVVLLLLLLILMIILRGAASGRRFPCLPHPARKIGALKGLRERSVKIRLSLTM